MGTQGYFLDRIEIVAMLAAEAGLIFIWVPFSILVFSLGLVPCCSSLSYLVLCDPCPQTCSLFPCNIFMTYQLKLYSHCTLIHMVQRFHFSSCRCHKILFHRIAYSAIWRQLLHNTKVVSHISILKWYGLSNIICKATKLIQNPVYSFK